MSSGESIKVVGKSESVQQTAVQGSRSPDQKGSAEGVGLFSFGDKETNVEEVEWCPSLLGQALQRKLIQTAHITDPGIGECQNNQQYP